MPRPRRAAAKAPPAAPTRSAFAKKHGLTQAQEDRIRETFAQHATAPHESTDAEEGAVPSSSVKRIFASVGAPLRTKAETEEIMEVLDPDDEGRVGFEELVEVLALKMAARDESESDGSGDGDGTYREEEDDEMESEGEVEVGGEARHLFGLVMSKKGREVGRTKLTLRDLRRTSKRLKLGYSESDLESMIRVANDGASIKSGVKLGEFEEVLARSARVK